MGICKVHSNNNNLIFTHGSYEYVFLEVAKHVLNVVH